MAVRISKTHQTRSLRDCFSMFLLEEYRRQAMWDAVEERGSDQMMKQREQ
jgi:hypothetical protein